MAYSTDRSKAVVPVLTLVLPCGLFYEAICFMSCLALFCYCIFQSFLALRQPHLGKRELVRLFDLCLFDCVCFLFLLVSGKGCGL